jgi:hypothetical protein
VKNFALGLITSLALAGPIWAQERAPDFHLVDVNTNSPRGLNTMVSPRDYLLQVSAYYFGDAG